MKKNEISLICIYLRKKNKKQKENQGFKRDTEEWSAYIKVLLDSTCILKYYVVLTNFYNFLSVLTLAREKKKKHRYSVFWMDPDCSSSVHHHHHHQQQQQQQQKYMNSSNFL